MKHNFYKVVGCLVFILMTAPIFAYDIIVTTDAKKIEAKILEVSKSEIKYKEHDNLDGPTFIISTDEISSIIYKNGKVVLYKQSEENTVKPDAEPISSEQNKGENIAIILLLSGNKKRGELVEMNNQYVSFLENGVKITIPASEINSVTLGNGQTRTYTNVSTMQEKNIQSKSTVNSKNSEENKNGRIFRDNGQYFYNDTYISSKEVERILQRENAAAYNQWKKAEGMLIGGSICTGIAGGLAIGGLFPLISKNYIATIGMECAAIVPLSIGLGLTLGASTHYNKAIDIYNSKYDHTAIQLKWQITSNGVGLALAF